VFKVLKITAKRVLIGSRKNLILHSPDYFAYLT